MPRSVKCKKKCKCNLFTHGAPRSSKNSFRNARAFQDRIGIWKCWFLRRGENRSTRRKTSRSRVENQQQTQPTYDAGSGNRTRDTLVGGERSHHYTNPAPYLKTMFLKLKYPAKLILLQMESDSIFKRFHASQDQNQSCIKPIDSPVLITLPFKDQKSADSVRKQLNDPGKKIDRVIQPVFTSRKISEDLKVTQTKPSLVNQQCVVYEVQCNSCDSNYIGYTSRHHLRIEEHKYSVIGKHLKDKHSQRPTNLHEHFTILKKCHGKFECLLVS